MYQCYGCKQNPIFKRKVQNMLPGHCNIFSDTCKRLQTIFQGMTGLNFDRILQGAYPEATLQVAIKCLP
jgi:hypothetical protein